MFTIPRSKRCHLFDTTDLLHLDFPCAFDAGETYVEDSHFSHRLVPCTDCSQLYLKEFYETIDWADGDDPQRVTLMPVVNAEAGKRLHDAFPNGLGAAVPRLAFGSPKGGPRTAGWVGMESRIDVTARETVRQLNAES